jgi:hypothetical protein
VDQLLSDERLFKPLNDFPLNVVLLLPLPLPKERIELSELGTCIDWLLRELKLRDDSLLDDILREDDDPLLPLLPLLLDERPP